MKFFSESQLEKLYGLPMSKISPTADPLEKYMCGHTTVSCPSCGELCDVKCGAVDNRTQFVEIAFCEACELLLSRPRDPVSDIISYQYGYARPDEREEYVCQYCKERHPFTVADGGWDWTSTASINSLERVYLDCPCGTGIVITQTELPEDISCPNESCSRTYSLLVEQDSN